MSKNQIKILMATIDLLRVQLDELISEEVSLTDPEVIKKSQELDQFIAKYYEMLKKMK
ncbi:MAG: aspartyl-phosphate phosphatase Spo0E family protein [Dehalobacterium sp.]